MDELELLKKDWNKTDTQFKSYSDKDIYKMTHKRSSNIVKTLFYISVAELIFWVFMNHILPVLLSDEMKTQIEDLSHSWIYMALNAISYVVTAVFIFLLWKSHKAISVTDNAKRLMESILNTRKIIKYYVLFILLNALVSIPVSLYFSLKEHPELSEQLSNASSSQLAIVIGICILGTALFLLVIWLFYKLIYGILIKRLNINYRELKRLEQE